MAMISLVCVTDIGKLWIKTGKNRTGWGDENVRKQWTTA